VQFGTVDHDAGGYTHRMSENTKTLFFVAWAIAVCLAAMAIGITSVPQWVVVALVAVVPPLVVRRFWRAPEQTISESIHNARR
jgi:Flp pilus assembly protein TadB